MRKAGIAGKNSLARVGQELRMEYYKQPLMDLNYGFLVHCLLVQGSTNLISRACEDPQGMQLLGRTHRI